VVSAIVGSKAFSAFKLFKYLFLLIIVPVVGAKTSPPVDKGSQCAPALRAGVRDEP
jgi:hypothetical protein